MWGAVGGSGVRTGDETLPEKLRMGREKRGCERKPGAAPTRVEQAPHLLTVSVLFAPLELMLPPRSLFKLLLRVSEWDRPCVSKLN